MDKVSFEGRDPLVFLACLPAVALMHAGMFRSGVSFLQQLNTPLLASPSGDKDEWWEKMKKRIEQQGPGMAHEVGFFSTYFVFTKMICRGNDRPVVGCSMRPEQGSSFCQSSSDNLSSTQFWKSIQWRQNVSKQNPWTGFLRAGK